MKTIKLSPSILVRFRMHTYWTKIMRDILRSSPACKPIQSVFKPRATIFQSTLRLRIYPLGKKKEDKTVY